jgi:hypothetical protein
LFLVLGRGASYVPIYNEYLQFQAGQDINSEGTVYHLKFDEIFKDDPELKVEHCERKNLGMTYVMMLRKQSKEEKVE